MSIRIAVIDNGVDSHVLQTALKHKIVIKNNEACQDKEDIEQTFFHGTNCALVIEKYCSDVELSSIRILDGKGKGMIADLKPALDWCCENGYFLVNLSFGTTHFKDKKRLREIVDYYANMGIIIVAASANNGYMSYPSSFENVIGVVSGEVFGVDLELQVMKGIDFMAPSNHEITVDGITVSMEKSNSYAAPYITAMVGNFILKHGKCELSIIKEGLYDSFGCYIGNKEQRNSQIINCKERECNLDIPVIICKTDETQEIFWWLCTLRDCFEFEGYNAYTVSDLKDCKHYDLEYISLEEQEQTEQEKLHDYFYWKTYYQQSDLVLMAISMEYEIGEVPDIEIKICGMETGCLIEIICDGQKKKQEHFTMVDENTVKKIYHIIVQLLEEDVDE